MFCTLTRGGIGIDQYRIPKGTLKAAGNQLGIFESLNDHVVQSDLDLYWKNLYQYELVLLLPDDRIKALLTCVPA